ncbi:hypothetical protein HYV84_06060 [Candidatus Woesearchaeota archaeon]|nr:hypothetical protein [Candidatus Woesearchaeota archaeon]
MTSIMIHKLRVQEHMQAIEEAIAAGIEKRPATIGLHVSACSVSLIELYLHVLGKITAGALIKHEWFKKPNPGQKILPLAERKLGVEFPRKAEILEQLYGIEEQRNKLIYGNPSRSVIEVVVSSYQKLYGIIKEELEARGEKLE